MQVRVNRDFDRTIYRDDSPFAFSFQLISYWFGLLLFLAMGIGSFLLLIESLKGMQ